MAMDEKIRSVSVMRVIAMLMIVCFHSLCFYTHRWWIFGGVYIPLWDKIASCLDAIDLPMFFFISGYLFGYLYVFGDKYRDKNKFLFAKFKRLLIPYFFWGVFLIIVMPSLSQWSDLLKGICHLWFLMALFNLFIIVWPFMDWLCRKSSYSQLVIVFLLSYVSFLLFHEYSSHHAFLSIHSSLYYLPFFLFGICCARFLKTKRISSKLSLFLWVFSLVSLSIYVFLFPKMTFYLDFLFIHIHGLVFVVSIFAFLNNVTYSNRLYSIVLKLDSLSMGIYIFNQIIINAFILIFGNTFLNVHCYTGPLLLFFIGFLIPASLSFYFAQNKYLKLTIG